MKRPLILAAIVALAIGLVALGAAAVRDAGPPTHAQGAATATPTTATAVPTATPTTTSTTTTTATATASTCTTTTLGEPRLVTGTTIVTDLAKDCDALLALRDKLPWPTALNWSPTLALTSMNTDGTIAQNWDGVTVETVGTGADAKKRVTELDLTGADAPYAFRDALAELAKLDALVDIHLAVYETPETTATTATALPANPPTCTATTLGESRVVTGTTTVTDLAKDCDTLLAIESTLKGTGTLNWEPTLALTSVNTDGTTAQNWDGVTVETVGTGANAKKRVVKLELPSKSLTGVIPTRIKDLTALTSLDLSKNRLGGSIPTQIGKLTALTSLNVRNNRLSGVIPTQLGNLTALTSLILDDWDGRAGHNAISGAIPTQLGNLGNLETFKLHDPNRTLTGGGIPPQLGNLSNLRELDIRHNPYLGGRDIRHNPYLGGRIPPELGNLTKLEKLKLVGLGLTGTIPPELGNLTRLENLRLKGNQLLTGAIPTEIRNLTLSLLDIRDTGVCAPAGLDLAATVRTVPTPLPACPAGN